MGKFAKVLVCGLFCLWSRQASGQAVVNENLETAFVYVDANNGSDSNPGTQALPYQTIGKAASVAVANNHQNIGTRVTINPGTYRESVTLSTSTRDTSLPITFEAATAGTAIMSGADVYSGWTVYSANPNIFTHSWTNNFGLCATDQGCPGPFQDIMRRREMVIVNGTVMTQVLSLTQMLPGTFYVDDNGSGMYLYPPPDTNMDTATVEVATRSGLFTIIGKNNIVLRGLVFQHDASCRSNAAVTVQGASSNVLIDNDQFLWNNARGLGVEHPAVNLTVQNSTANHNGSMGFHAYEVKNVLWQADETSYNNWRGAQSAYYGCNNEGVLFFSTHSNTIVGLTANYNEAHGLHWDTDNQNITASGILAVENLVDALLIEKDEGPFTITASNLCNNAVGTFYQSSYGAGVQLRNSESVTLTGSALLNNGQKQINVEGVAGGIAISNWETGQQYNLITKNFTNSGNSIEGSGTQQVFSDGYLGGSDWTSFQNTLVSALNTWWNSSNASAFTTPSPKDGTVVDLGGWQSLTGQDALSTFAPPLPTVGAACNVSPDAPDFWFLSDQVQVTLSAAGQATFNVNVMPLAFTGTVNLSLDGVAEVKGLSGTLSAPTINTSGSSQVTLTSSGAAPGTYPITVLANSGSTTRTVTISLIVPQTSLRLSTGALAFASQQINTTSPPQTFSITNNGANSVSIFSISASKNFSATNTCGGSIGPGRQCTVSVTFTPNLVGSITGTVTIMDSDPSSPQIVSLSGTGTGAPTVKLTPASLNFGSQVVGTASASRIITVTNTGSVSASITGVTLNGANPGDYTQTNNCIGTMAAGASCTINVTFKPLATGSRKAKLTVSDNASGGSQSASLSGTGVR